MIRSVGIDCVDLGRVESMIERWGDRFLERMFSPGEVGYCRAKPRASEHFGARIAAKEACMKCLGRGVWGGVGFRDIETVRDDDGTPRIVLHGRARDEYERKGGRALHLSLSHIAAAAVAVVIMEGNASGHDRDEGLWW